MGLYQDYRPQTLDEVYGQESTVQALASLLERVSEAVPHAMLFAGPSGCGKTTLARIVAQELECSEFDLKELDIADFRGIDTIRSIRQTMACKPMQGQVRVWILDEAHKLTRDAQNALLKALEDTPEHTYFMLATTEPKSLLKTIQTRCTTFELSEIDEEDLEDLVESVAEAEEVELPEGLATIIAGKAQGSARMALVILDKVIGLEGDEMEEAAQSFQSAEKQTIDLCRTMLKKPKWKDVAVILRELEEDPETVRRSILGYMNAVLLKSANPKAYAIAACFAEPYYNTGKAGLTMSCFEAVEGT